MLIILSLASSRNNSSSSSSSSNNNDNNNNYNNNYNNNNVNMVPAKLVTSLLPEESLEQHGFEAGVVINKSQKTSDAFKKVAANASAYNATVLSEAAMPCQVVAYNMCETQAWCVNQCYAMGSQLWVWFKNGCCECVGPIGCTNPSWPPYPLCRNCH